MQLHKVWQEQEYTCALIRTDIAAQVVNDDPTGTWTNTEPPFFILSMFNQQDGSAKYVADLNCVSDASKELLYALRNYSLPNGWEIRKNRMDVWDQLIITIRDYINGHE